MLMLCLPLRQVVGLAHCGAAPLEVTQSFVAPAALKTTFLGSTSGPPPAGTPAAAGDATAT